MVDLKITAVHDDAQRRADDQPHRVRNAVADGEELHLEAAQPDLAAGGQDVEIDVAAYPLLFQRHPDQAVGQLGGVDRGVQFGDQIGQPADMVLVAVGVKPNREMADRAGLELGPGGSIAVALHQKMTVEAFSPCDLAYAPPFSPVWDPMLTAANQLIKRM